MSTEDCTFLISPTEPVKLREIGAVSPIVENKGCDVLIILPKLRIGVQRKTWMDLVISLDDGRLAGSIPKMDMEVRVVIIEGPTPNFSGPDGKMIARSSSRLAKHGIVTLRHTKKSLAGVFFSLRYKHGLDVLRSDNLDDTIMLVQRLGNYLSKPHHVGVIGRRTGGMGTNDWGADVRERQASQRVNFLMAAGVGRKTAENILKANNGTVPLKWTFTREQFLGVPLIGSSVADKLMKLLE